MNLRPPACKLDAHLSVHVSPHKPMTAFIPDDVSLCKPMEVGVGVESGAENSLRFNSTFGEKRPNRLFKGLLLSPSTHQHFSSHHLSWTGIFLFSNSSSFQILPQEDLYKTNTLHATVAVYVLHLVLVLSRVLQHP